MFPQKELEEVEFHLQLKVQEEAHPMVHPIHQKKAEEANQQVGLLQEERARGVIHQFLPHQKHRPYGLLHGLRQLSSTILFDYFVFRHQLARMRCGCRHITTN